MSDREFWTLFATWVATLVVSILCLGGYAVAYYYLGNW